MEDTVFEFGPLGRQTIWKQTISKTFTGREGPGSANLYTHYGRLTGLEKSPVEV